MCALVATLARLLRTVLRLGSGLLTGPPASALSPAASSWHSAQRPDWLSPNLSKTAHAAGQSPLLTPHFTQRKLRGPSGLPHPRPPPLPCLGSCPRRAPSCALEPHRHALASGPLHLQSPLPPHDCSSSPHFLQTCTRATMSPAPLQEQCSRLPLASFFALFFPGHLLLFNILCYRKFKSPQNLPWALSRSNALSHITVPK